MKKKLIAFLLAAMLISATAVSVNAGESEGAATGAPVDAGVVAADYEDVGGELEADETLPSYYSSLDLGYVTPVRSQVYNTCWAYSSLACTEILLNKLGVETDHLSTMDMNFQGTTKDDGTGWQRTYSAAGYPYIAMGHLTALGAVAEAKVPDTMTYDEYIALEERPDPFCYVDSIVYLGEKDVESAKAAVYKYGAAVGNFHYSTAYLNSETFAYYCDLEDIATSNLFGHAITIVGWDDSYSAENFLEEHRPSKDGAWLCKNSWGSWWGNQNGYFWISYEDEHLFDKRFGPSYAISGVTVATPLFELVQNELYGATYKFKLPEGRENEFDELTYVNVMDFAEEYDTIDKVSFETTSAGADYEIYYIPVGEDGVPSAPESEWTLLYSGTAEYNGYICADIEDFKVSAGKGAIAVRMKNTGSPGEILIGVDEWLTVSDKFIFKPQCERGLSYVIGYKDEPMDLLDYYMEKDNDDIGGTFVIKAMTYADRIIGDVDGDGVVTILDATHIQRYLAGLNTFSKVKAYVADYDLDGSVSIIDATRIQRFLAGFTS